MKPCRLMDYCYGKNSLNFEIDSRQNWPTGSDLQCVLYIYSTSHMKQVYADTGISIKVICAVLIGSGF